MRSQVHLDRVVEGYRLFSIIGAAMVLLIVGLCVWGVLLAPRTDGAGIGLLAALVVAVAALLVVLRWGYLRLRSDLRAAASEQNRLLDTAHRDSLTGAFTRSHFLGRLRELLHERTIPLAYLQIDMDNLKIINDAHGHGAGDAALVHLVRTVTKLLPDALIGRLGGDEFAIAVDGHDNRAVLRRLGDQLLGEFGKPLHIAGRPVRLSATIGAALWPFDASDVSELISKADLALYKGKRSGRAATIAFDPEMLADERHKRFVDRELRAAILMNELDLHYQPVFAADGVTLRSHEALVRWQHTVRGQIFPNDFIPIAEQSDLIDKLGDWVLRRACIDFDRLDTPAVAINVSAVQLRRTDFAARFTAILADTGISGDRIIVEVTETVPMQSGAVELANLNALRALGIRVAIDDFGAGHASLENLRNFAFDIIKIDRSYIANLPESRVDALIVGAICDIARSLGVTVVAEGVETEEQLRFLQRKGCTALQGYLLGKPAPLPGPVPRLFRATPIASAA